MKDPGLGAHKETAVPDIMQFEGMHFRDAQAAMSDWTDEQLLTAAKATDALRDVRQREADRILEEAARIARPIAGEARNWELIGWAARDLGHKRMEAEAEASRSNSAELENQPGRVRSLGSRIVRAFAGAYHPDMFR